MRVIRDGVEIEKKCPHCNSVLGITPEDVKDCSGVGRTWVVCVVCDGRIDIKMNEMPPLFKRRVDWDE